MERTNNQLVLKGEVSEESCPSCHEDGLVLQKSFKKGTDYIEIYTCATCNDEIKIFYTLETDYYELKISAYLEGIMCVFDMMYETYLDEHMFEWDDVKDDFRDHLMRVVAKFENSGMNIYEHELLTKYVKDFFKEENESQS